MELQDELTALKSENKAYKDFLENVNAEKIALDQLLVETLKTSLNDKKERFLQQEKVNKLKIEKDVLIKEKESLQAKLDDLINENTPS